MEEFIELFEELLEVDEGTMKPEDTFRDYDEWDSLAMLGLGAMINDEYDVTIPRVDFEKIDTVQELFDYINNNK